MQIVAIVIFGITNLYLINWLLILDREMRVVRKLIARERRLARRRAALAQ